MINYIIPDLLMCIYLAKIFYLNKKYISKFNNYCIKFKWSLVYEKNLC